nr:PE family protein [Mycobacterium pseudoshottsii]
MANIGSAINTANTAVAAPTAELLAAGTDEVSEAIASLFSGHALDYQSLGARMTAFHDQFVAALTAGGGLYSSAEAAAATPLQDLLNVVNAPHPSTVGAPADRRRRRRNRARAGRRSRWTALRQRR